VTLVVCIIYTIIIAHLLVCKLTISIFAIFFFR